jgi:mannose-6-phosphate isomerase-like protein (cupin superfamily)
VQIAEIYSLKEFVAGDGCLIKEVMGQKAGDPKIGYSISQARVKIGRGTLLHRLKSSEVYIILQGRGRLSIDAERREVSEGQVIYIPPNSKQKIENIGNSELVFLAIVSPPWKKDDEEVLE